MTDETQTKQDPSALISALNGLVEALRASAPGTRFTDQHSYNAAPLDPQDLAITSEEIASRISAFEWEGVEDAESYFDDLAEKVQWAKKEMIPQIRSSPTVINSVLVLLFSVDIQVRSLIAPEVI